MLRDDFRLGPPLVRRGASRDDFGPGSQLGRRAPDGRDGGGAGLGGPHLASLHGRKRLLLDLRTAAWSLQPQGLRSLFSAGSPSARRAASWQRGAGQYHPQYAFSGGAGSAFAEQRRRRRLEVGVALGVQPPNSAGAGR